MCGMGKRIGVPLSRPAPSPSYDPPQIEEERADEIERLEKGVEGPASLCKVGKNCSSHMSTSVQINITAEF